MGRGAGCREQVGAAPETGGFGQRSAGTSSAVMLAVLPAAVWAERQPRWLPQAPWRIFIHWSLKPSLHQLCSCGTVTFVISRQS